LRRHVYFDAADALLSLLFSATPIFSLMLMPFHFFFAHADAFRHFATPRCRYHCCHDVMP